MNKSQYKATGCLWIFMESVCVILFIILLVMKLCGTPLKWGTVIGPLIVGLAISIVVFLVLIVVSISEDKKEKE